VIALAVASKRQPPAEIGLNGAIAVQFGVCVCACVCVCERERERERERKRERERGRARKRERERERERDELRRKASFSVIRWLNMWYVVEING